MCVVILIKLFYFGQVRINFLKNFKHQTNSFTAHANELGNVGPTLMLRKFQLFVTNIVTL